MIDFKVPRFWVKNKGGGSHYPKEIENWFSEDFDNYFIYHHPILIDLDIQNGLKPSRDEFGRPKNKRVLTFDQFKAEFFKDGENFKNYSEYVMHQVRNKDTRPNYLWGSEEGSGMYYKDIIPILKVFDPNLQAEVYSHYDILRKIRGNLENDNLPSYYMTKMETIEIVASSFSNLSPEFILDKNKKWCFTTLYDDCKTAIACDNETAEKLIEHKDLGIEKIKTLHKTVRKL
ncbi:hypothetical protein [Polaribacter gangjinensis]|uniref:Uncharacterized protein n=1 Tax=Polaribacter gangjinensis TaxID=574710 RepID=A0A2S7W9I3_9FLAO|nr:hypothetical protein [Polaribacter gangjinensis]PQJ74294.1 hypothetical protein BTO13_02960 [Polaribacter gangjinensis]